MKIELKEISYGLPGLSKVSGEHLFESCIVCLTRQKHSNENTTLEIKGDKIITSTLVWDNIFNEQLDRTWKDQFYATEHGAVCIAILLALKLTNYTIIEKSARKNGFDYWLGEKEDILFQKKARLEISGIFQGTDKDIKQRYNIKVKQTQQSDTLNIPAYIGIVEFSKPIAIFEAKK